MYPFDTKNGRLMLGLTVGSGGGWIITNVQQRLRDPQWRQFLQLLLVFWIIFTLKTTLVYVRQLNSPAVAATPAAPAADGGSGGAGERAGRRRRTRRD